MDKYLLTRQEIEALDGTDKTHFLNQNARRNNKSLGDLTGLTGIGFHIIEIAPGCETTEKHLHYYEDECVYILQGQGTAIIGDERFDIAAGDFIGYRAGGLAHTIINDHSDILKCIVVGQRLPHDVADYPNQNKRIFRNQGIPWELVDKDHIIHPVAGKK